jgi:membrane protein YqaA with SNARE-associated domain
MDLYGEKIINEKSSVVPPFDDIPQSIGASLTRKILSIFIILTIAALSIVIFINREKLQYIGNYGLLGVFILCFICNATVLAPAPSLIVIVTAAAFLNPMLVALCGAFGTTLGELTGYLSGKAGRNIGRIKIGRLGKAVQKYGSPVIFCFALFPLPLFDIIGVASGFLGIKWYKFVIPCFLGKLIKMLCFAYSSYYFQEILDNSINFING